MAPLIAARHISKRFLLRHLRPSNIKDRVLETIGARPREADEEFWALRDISLDIGAGEAVGLVGRNGSGKSTLLRIMAGLLTPTAGAIWVPRGTRIGTMIELGVGFNPELTGRENVFLTGAVHGLSRSETRTMYDAIVDYAGLGAFMDVPLMNYSSGMQVRLAFASSIYLDPDVLLVDEIFAVGDEDFQGRCRDTMLDFRDRGKTIIFVSHSPTSVREICDRVCVIDQSRLCFDGGVDEGLDCYHSLLAATHVQGRA